MKKLGIILAIIIVILILIKGFGEIFYFNNVEISNGKGELILTRDIVLMLLPLVLIQLGMALYCAIKIFKEGVQNLNKWAWLAICLFINLLGPIIFLIIGRKQEYR